ncbi:transposase [Kitasatospora sp. NPDC001540]|uniref:transposase n=1 Tax=Kitasatospora sp. NPDC001540 TaxID=3364014 RepID=UPI0036930477
MSEHKAHPSSSGHSGSYEYRGVVNAIFYRNRTGCQWAYPPHDLPSSSATTTTSRPGVKVEIVKRSPDDVGFVPQAKSRVSEQVNGILMWHRHLVRDYEALPANAESRVYWAITANMSRRPTKESTPSWRGA